MKPHRIAVVLLLFVCASCELLTGVGIRMGLVTEPKGDGSLVRAAKAVDSAIGDWFWTLILGGGAAASQAHGPTRRKTIAAVKATGRVILRKPPQRVDAKSA